MTLPPPLVAAGEAYYQAEREKRFSISPAARENWLRYQTWLNSRPESVDPKILPIKAHISPNSQCNFRCTMCAVSDFPRGKRAEPMRLERFREIVEQLPTICEAHPAGLSEILMMPQDDLLAMLAVLRNAHIWVQLVTNGSLLDQKQWIPKLLELDINEWCVSIDGASKKTFEQIRRGSNFERVINNLELLAQEASGIGVLNRIKLQMTLQQSNQSEIGDVLRIASRLGIGSVALSVDIFDWGSVTWRNRNQPNSANLQSHVLSDAIDLGKSLGIYVGVIEISNRYSASGPMSGRCQWPFSAVFISSDDRIVPCCHISNPDHFEIDASSATYPTMEARWFSPAYLEFREAHVRGNIPEACRACYLNAPLPQASSHHVSITRKSSKTA